LCHCGFSGAWAPVCVGGSRYDSNMLSERDVVAAFDRLDAAVEELTALGFDALTTPERLALLERCERVRRLLPVAAHPLLNQLQDQASRDELGGSLAQALANSAADHPQRGHPPPQRGPRPGRAARPDR
jgi:hypothetical protein